MYGKINVPFQICSLNRSFKNLKIFQLVMLCKYNQEEFNFLIKQYGMNLLLKKVYKEL